MGNIPIFLFAKVPACTGKSPHCGNLRGRVDAALSSASAFVHRVWPFFILVNFKNGSYVYHGNLLPNHFLHKYFVHGIHLPFHKCYNGRIGGAVITEKRHLATDWAPTRKIKKYISYSTDQFLEDSVIIGKTSVPLGQVCADMLHADNELLPENGYDNKCCDRGAPDLPGGWRTEKGSKAGGTVADSERIPTGIWQAEEAEGKWEDFSG